MQLRKYLQPTTFNLRPTTSHLLLISLLIFLAPTNLFWKMLPNYGFVGGLQIDYLIPKLYLSDLVCISIVGSGLLENIRRIKTKQLTNHSTQQLFFLITCLLLFLVRQLFTPYPVSALWFLSVTTLHIATVFIASSWCKQFDVKSKRLLFLVLCSTVIFQSFIGIYQFTFQHQLMGFLFFGEPELSVSRTIMRTDWHFVDNLMNTSLGLRIAPYGTTAHPNILAGFLALSVLTIICEFRRVLSGEKKHPLLFNGIKLPLTIFSLLIGLTVLVLTTSMSALIAFGLGLTILFSQKFAKKNIALITLFILLSIITPFILHIYAQNYPLNTSVVRRDRLNTVALQLTKQQYLTGVGVNQFTAVAEDFPNQKEFVRFAQPAHNLLLLFLAENGALGVLILTLLLRTVSRQFEFDSAYLQLFIILSPIILLDHYFYTLVPGQLILVFSVLCLVTSKKPLET